MSSITIGIIVFAFVFGGALLGILLHAVLPVNHLNPDSRDVVKLGMGLVGTVAALVLGLLVASAKESYDKQSNELTEMSAKLVLLDRVLAHYGPETQEVRALLREFVVQSLDGMWANDSSSPSQSGVPLIGHEIFYDKMQELSPKDDLQRSLKTQALIMVMNIAETRWLMATQRVTPVSMTLIVVLIFWLTIIFISFGLFAPRNVTVTASLFFSALAVSCAILLILEMYAPYSGLIQVSSAPLRAALSHLGQ